MLKLMEETGELAEGIAKNRPDQIKDRKGKMIDGVFVKESDL